MGRKKAKRIIKRRRLPELLLGRKSYRCLVCYPDKRYQESSERMPIVETIYVARKTIKTTRGKVKIRVAWCAECNRWLAREIGHKTIVEDVDFAQKLSDGECGKGRMKWEMFKTFLKGRGGKREPKIKPVDMRLFAWRDELLAEKRLKEREMRQHG